MIEERKRIENGPMEPNETETRVRVETEVTYKKRLIIDELKALIIRNETDEYLLLNKVDTRKLRDITKKVNAAIRHIKTDDVTQTNKLAMAAVVAKEVGVKKGQRGEKKEPQWKR